MDVEERLGACGDSFLRLTDIPLSKCHWASFVSMCFQLEHSDPHAKVQHRCYTDWMDDVWAARVAESYEEPHVGLRHLQAAPAHTVPRPHSCRRSRHEIAKLVVVAEYTSRLTSQYVYLCPGESVLH